MAFFAKKNCLKRTWWLFCIQYSKRVYKLYFIHWIDESVDFMQNKSLFLEKMETHFLVYNNSGESIVLLLLVLMTLLYFFIHCASFMSYCRQENHITFITDKTTKKDFNALKDDEHIIGDHYRKWIYHRKKHTYMHCIALHL